MSRGFAYQAEDDVGLATLETMAQADRFNRWMYEVVAAELLPGPTLEVGSGIGNVSMHFLANGTPLTMSDLRPAYCAHLRSAFGGHPHAQGVVQLDLVAEAFDQRYAAMLGQYTNVYALNVVEHIADDGVAVRNAYQLLRPGGRLLILVPAYPWLYNGFDAQLQHYRRYTRRRLTETLGAQGIPVRRSFFFNLIGIAGWFVSGGLLKRSLIPTGQMRLYNRLVPIFRYLDRLAGQRAGLSVVCVGEKPLTA
jgi:SAM-dependent methyltransferase